MVVIEQKLHTSLGMPELSQGIVGGLLWAIQDALLAVVMNVGVGVSIAPVHEKPVAYIKKVDIASLD